MIRRGGWNRSRGACVTEDTGTRFRKVPVIEFNENPTGTIDEASVQLEHLYIHVGILGDGLNALVEDTACAFREVLDRLEHLERRLAGEWPYARDTAAASVACQPPGEGQG